MAITTLSPGVVSSFQQPQAFAKANISATQGRPISWWGLNGFPGAGTFNTTLNGGTYSSSSSIPAGAIPHTDPGTGNAYLARLQASLNGGPGEIILADRLWDNGGITITSTTAQTIASPAWPARDGNGATSGYQVYLGVEVSAVTGAGTPTLTIGYTNSAGTTLRTGTNIDNTIATAPAGSFYRIALQAGDIGVQSVQSITLSATWTSGTINVVAYRLLGVLEIAANGYSNSIDAVTGGFPQLFNGTCPFLMCLPAATAAFGTMGLYLESQG